jgi:c-di-GMP-binding flagellar brake protein YcgR
MSDKSVTGIAKDLRKSARKILLSNAIFVSQNIRLKSAITIDISTGGMSLVLPVSLAVGQSCAISFDVPDQHSKQRILINGTIVSCIAKGEAYRIGVHYIETDPISRQLIQAAIHSYLK